MTVEREPLFVAPSGPETSSPFGDSLRWIVGEEATDGSYSLHHRTAPPGAASVPHVHSRVIEAFYVLEGEFEFEVGGQKVMGGPGTYVQAPAGVSHAWRVAGQRTARALVLFSPGVPRAFFDEIDPEVRREGGPSRERLRAINEKYGLA